MSFELTINRVMALCEPARIEDGVGSREEYVKLFRSMMLDMAHQNVDSLYAKIGAAAEEVGARMEAAPAGLELDLVKKPPSQAADVLRIPPVGQDSTEHFVGRFAPRTFSLKLDKRSWWIRTRASVSACTLQSKDGRPKLSLTFEGVPQDAQSTQRPNEGDSVSFLKTTSAMATAGIKPLRDAYAAALDRATNFRGGLSLRPGLVRINLADNDTPSFAALVDAMSFDGVSYAAALAGKAGAPASEGASLVKSFVAKVEPNAADNTFMSVEWARARDVGVLARWEKRTTKAHDVVMAGLTRSTKMMGGYDSQPGASWRMEHEPAYLRFVSGARHLSAKLAMQQAALFDEQLTAAPQPELIVPARTVAASP